jgi:hypothetical protein
MYAVPAAAAAAAAAGGVGGSGEAQAWCVEPQACELLHVMNVVEVGCC